MRADNRTNAIAKTHNFIISDINVLLYEKTRYISGTTVHDYKVTNNTIIFKKINNTVLNLSMNFQINLIFIIEAINLVKNLHIYTGIFPLFKG